MLRNLNKVAFPRKRISSVNFQRTFLTNDYKCSDAWKERLSSPILNKVKLNDFYNVLDQSYATKGVITAIDVDIFANSLKDPTYLEELRDLLHKLRLSAETGYILDSTHHAIVRNYIEFERIQDLIDILRDPLNYGVFLDDYAANILLDKLITSSKYEEAANVASLIMLQEDYGNDITCSLCQYACYKYITSYSPRTPEKTEPEGKNKKVEEIKIRVKYLRNPYFDDHFDIKDVYTLAGKTLAWISQRNNDNLCYNLQIIGWLVYKKYDNLFGLCQECTKTESFKVYPEVVQFLQKELAAVGDEIKEYLNDCVSTLSEATPMEVSLEESIQIAIENAINKTQNNDISEQKKLFKLWAAQRESSLQEQIKRLDRAKRMQLIEQKQNQLKEEEQRLWFFDNEDKIDLQIEEKEKLVEPTVGKKQISKTADENYIPPEITPQRK
ncbi:uncharacterized protein LOC128669389 [Plodia interpunctella]|uniref:uncharacterized protein LOC128669389 n=1 Tax=Plodia interpunctella TaxID=58824 RepID=UPI00236862F1|nr:uncharacterized protein LOC128669389 [Plodia interpunctella]